MEAPVKPINKRTEVANSVFGEIERMVSAAKTGLEVAHDGVDPTELRQILGFACANDDGCGSFSTTEGCQKSTR